MTPQERFLLHRLGEELRWMHQHHDPHATSDDAMRYLRDQCGFTETGCLYRTSEYCRLDCPFTPEDRP